MGLRQLLVLPNFSMSEFIETIKDSGNIVGVVLFLITCILFYVFQIRQETEGYRAYYQEKKRDWTNLILLLGVAFVIKAIYAVKFEGHGTDMGCFYAWSDMIYDNGISKFYYLDAFTDYPPGYMALLWVIAAIRHLFNVELTSNGGRLLIKLIPILADLFTGLLIYVVAKKRFSETTSIMLTAIYVLNPIVILDSSIWGQTDSVFTIFVLLTCYFCMEEKRALAYFAYIIGVLIKPQAIMFAPIIIFTIIEQIFLRKTEFKKIIKELVIGLSSIATMFLLAAPFGLGKVISQYTDTLGSYEYCTINAYNFWALLGKNWADQNETFLSIKYSSWGNLAIAAAIGVSAYIFFKRLKDDKSKYFISMAIVGSTMFLFSVRMHERYLFPVIALVMMAFLVKPTREMFFTYVGFSVVCFANVAYVLNYFEEKGSTGPEGGIIGMIALGIMAMYGYMFFALRKDTQIAAMLPSSQQIKKNGKLPFYEQVKAPAVREKKERKPWEKISATRELPKWTRKDWIVLGAIVLFYSCFALYDLGNDHAPVTHWERNEENQGVITLDLGEEHYIKMMHGFLGNYEDRKFMAEVSHDGENYARIGVIVANGVFSWNRMSREEEDGNPESYNLVENYRYIRLTCEDDLSVMNELIIVDDQNQVLEPVNKDEYKALFDEQDEYVRIPTFREGTYFDEIYHARTAYEMTQGLYNYENTHPPLGKYFISLGVRMFGMNPYGWRIVGTIFGILMLPFMYLFGRRLFKGKTWAAGALTFLFAFDFMHFTQTRIATIDVYGTFFIIAMFYFMYWYSQMSFYDTPLRKTFIPLGLSAIMMGLGCASKWTAVYAAAGLGIFFFAIMIRRIYEYRVAKADLEGETSGISHKQIVKVFKKNLIATLGFCVLFHIIIAGGIYLLSYIPYSDGCETNEQRFEYQLNDEENPVSETYRSIAEALERNQNGFTELLGKAVRNANTMYNYHSQLNAEHPFSSKWYEWPGMVRPMYYYSATVENDKKEGISAFGNPLVWWAGIPALIYMLYLIIAERNRKAGFIVFAYFVQYAPWMLVERCIFAYHYFPSVPFVCMMLVYTMVRLREKNEKWFKWILIYLGIAFLLFILFYPVLSGQPVSNNFVRDGLRWREGWILIS